MKNITLLKGLFTAGGRWREFCGTRSAGLIPACFMVPAAVGKLAHKEVAAKFSQPWCLLPSPKSQGKFDGIIVQDSSMGRAALQAGGYGADLPDAPRDGNMLV